MTTEILVDARWRDPPEPMEMALDAIGRLAPGQHVRLLLHREPLPLYGMLRQMGLTHETRPIEQGCYEILIVELPDRSPR